MDEHESLSHTTWDCKYRVVFIPKCWRKTLYRELRRHLGEVLPIDSVGAHRGRPLTHCVKPSTEIGEVVEVLLLAFPGNDPGVAGLCMPRRLLRLLARKITTVRRHMI